jgi:hypothetical protein
LDKVSEDVTEHKRARESVNVLRGAAVPLNLFDLRRRPPDDPEKHVAENHAIPNSADYEMGDRCHNHRRVIYLHAVFSSIGRSVTIKITKAIRNFALLVTLTLYEV